MRISPNDARTTEGVVVRILFAVASVILAGVAALGFIDYATCEGWFCFEGLTLIIALFFAVGALVFGLAAVHLRCWTVAVVAVYFLVMFLGAITGGFGMLA